MAKGLLNIKNIFKVAILKSGLNVGETKKYNDLTPEEKEKYTLSVGYYLEDGQIFNKPMLEVVFENKHEHAVVFPTDEDVVKYVEDVIMPSGNYMKVRF